MKKLMTALAAIVAFCIVAAAVARADENGTVGAKTGNGSYQANFPTSVKVAPRDVYNVVRGGKVVGQAMVLIVQNQGMVAVEMSGSIQTGDQLVFVRHDAVPTTPSPAMVANPNAAPVNVTGPKTPEWMKPDYYGNDGIYPYAYSDYNYGVPVSPIYGGGVFDAGGVHYPGTYGGHVYAPHVGVGGFRR